MKKAIIMTLLLSFIANISLQLETRKHNADSSFQNLHYYQDVNSHAQEVNKISSGVVIIIAIISVVAIILIAFYCYKCCNCMAKMR